MKQFVTGVIVGTVLTGSLGLAANFYNGSGTPSAPTGSVQQYDYFRFRQQMIDINQMNKRAQDAQANRFANPCR